jgi:hypothetical protein
MHRILSCALIAVAAVLALSGCNWTGEGKDVAAAIAASSQVKSRAFKGSMEMDMSKMTGTAGATATGSGGPQSLTMTFSGAIDSSNAAAPKMQMTMVAQGQMTSMVAPGDGKMYLTNAGKSYALPLPPETASKHTIDPQKIYVALGDAVGNFQKSQPITNAEGKPVDTTTATLDKAKLCGPVLEAFGDAMSQSTGLGSALGSSGTMTETDKSGKSMMQSFCKAMLKDDPRVWFGIDGGKLTDVELSAALTIPFAGPMAIEVQYHEYNQDQPQTGFDVPSGATPLSSFSALPAA